MPSSKEYMNLNKAHVWLAYMHSFMWWWGEEGGNIYEQACVQWTQPKKNPIIRPVQDCITIKVNGTKEKLEKNNIPGTWDANASQVSGVIAVRFPFQTWIVEVDLHWRYHRN